MNLVCNFNMKHFTFNLEFAFKLYFYGEINCTKRSEIKYEKIFCS